MADVKISGLPASTVPLAGTEVLPIVQGGTTKQVSIANVTAGRSVAALSVITPTIQAEAGSAGGTIKNGSGVAQMQWGSGGASNLSLEVPTNINPANGAVNISPTGTGTVTISPAGALTINPTAASTINNTSIGVTTAAAGRFSSITNTAFTAGSVVFTGASGLYSQNNANLFWDDVNGRLGVGTTTPYSKLELYNGIFLPNSGEATGIGSLRITNNQNALSGDGGIEFKGSGDSGGNGSKIQNLNGIGLAFAVRTNSATWTQALGLGTTADVTVNTGNLVIGTSGKGIDFSATAGTGTSELLADYEEGTWVPTVLGSTTNPTMSYLVQYGSYTKVGRLVSCECLVRGNRTAGGSGRIQIGGLPFTSSGLDIFAWSVCIGSSSALATLPEAGLVRNADTKLDIFSGTYGNTDVTNWGADDFIYCSFSYEV